MRTLSPHAVTVQRIRVFLCGGLSFFMGGLLLYFFPWPGVIWLSVCFSVSAAALFLYVPAYCRSVTFRLESDRLVIRKGVLFQKTIFIGRDKIQYVRMVVTPAARLYHTASLFFLLAGQTVWLGELERGQAQRLQEELADETYDPQDASAGDAPPS